MNLDALKTAIERAADTCTRDWEIDVESLDCGRTTWESDELYLTSTLFLSLMVESPRKCKRELRDALAAIIEELDKEIKNDESKVNDIRRAATHGQDTQPRGVA